MPVKKVDEPKAIDPYMPILFRPEEDPLKQLNEAMVEVEIAIEELRQIVLKSNHNNHNGNT